MFWVLRKMPTSDNDVRINGQPDTVKKLGLNFGKGLKIPHDFTEIIITRTKNNPGSLTDNLLAYGATGFVFNSKIRNILKKLDVTNIDYYKTVVEDDIEGTEARDYKIANIVGLVKCVDFGKSKLRIDDDGSIEAIKKFVLDQDALNETELKIFRVAEYFPITLVHNSIKEAFEAEAVTGLGFIDPDKFVL